MLNRQTLIGASLLRVALLLYGEWQDAHMDVKFTDVDYWVFTDAATSIATGGSPFDRTTYRYTPLLAYALLPNHYISKVWGKLIFCATDILAALFIFAILTRKMGVDQKRAGLIVNCGWLFNPLIFTISTRGNAESLLCSLILGTLYFLMEGNLVVSGLLFGLSVHLKLFPAIFSFAFLPFIWNAGWKTSKPEVGLKHSPSQESLTSSVVQDESPLLRAIATPSPLLGSSHSRKKMQSKPVGGKKKRAAAFLGISKKFLNLVVFGFWSLASFAATTGPMFYLY